MSVVTVLSALAMALGLAGALPQIARMMRARSAAGQSAVGWGMGVATNASMAYVNFFGFHAPMLTLSNLLSGALCAAAIVLIVRLGEGEPPPPERPATLVDMPTCEFVALRDAVLYADQERAEQRQSSSVPAFSVA